MTDLDWALDAACRMSRAWTDENCHEHRIPGRPCDGCNVLRQVCADCTVRKTCAKFALETEAESGMYAGIWLPPKMCGARPHVKRPAAVKQLELIADGVIP